MQQEDCTNSSIVQTYIMKNRILYLECNSGISGDMTVAALLDLGADRQALADALNSLPLSGYSIEIKEVFKSGIRACDFNVLLDSDNHDHDMQYLHGNSDTSDSLHEHSRENSDTSDSLHEHSHADCSEKDSPDHSSSTCPTGHIHTDSAPGDAHTHHHASRNLKDIVEIITAGSLTTRARTLAIRIFRILAEAEASVHGKSMEEVHFHEVGAVDSIVDIVAAAVCIDNLQPDQIIVSPLTDGHGQIRCQHGLIPIPVPAVAAIAVNHGLTLKSIDVEGELVTPTGAAIAAALPTGDSLPTEYRITKIGLGAGKRNYATSGLLRAMLIEPVSEDNHDTVLTLETNIDDCTGEALSYTMQQLMEAGALDVFCIPVYMKKNRPAQLLKVICESQDRERMEAIIFRNTTTIGIRYQELHRTKLDRRILAVETPWGMADVKCCTFENETYYYPENDSVCRLAEDNKTGFSEMYGMIQAYVRAREKGSRNGTL